MPRRRPACWIFGLLLLAACSNEPVRNLPSPPVQSRLPVKRMPPAEPVKSYGLADDQSSRHLLNADTYIQAGDSASAQKELDLIDLSVLSPEQQGKFKLLDAELALSMGDAERAVQQLESVRYRLLSREDQLAYHQSLAFAQALQGNVLPAVNARIRLGNLLQNPEQQQANIVAILDMLGTLPLESLNAPADMADELGGWLALAKILKQRDQAGFDVDGQIRQWRQAFPTHPANAEFLQAYLAAPQPATQTADTGQPAATPTTGSAIAVLLPDSGPYASAGKAIKEGLSLAQRLAAAGSPQLPLRFYDSTQVDIAVLYKQAVNEGAKQVIGPLVKEQIQALAQGAELTVPVLALNHVENLNKTNLYQFGLSPIDEAEQLALKARRDGRQSAVLLLPNNSQGQRIGHYLAAAWQRNGGIVAGMQSYDPKQHDIAAMLNALLAPSGSAPQQQQTVLLSVTPDVARELAPQLKYYQAGDLAVYAMPNIYSGRQNPAQDAELGRINFCDIPWLFADAYSGPLSQSATQNQWQALPETTTRLLALGIDAYNLLSQLPQLATTPYSGATGRLSLVADNRIARKLVCAQFKGGVPVSSGFVE